MAYIGNKLADAYTSFAKQDFTTSATTSYTLDNPVANENEIALFINFVRQEPTTAYTASGTSLTLTSATSASDDMYCVFLGKAVQTVNPPAGSVNTSQLADTSVTPAKLNLNDNLLFNTADKGIYLGVTSATASNLLDDYEEGTWTPTFSTTATDFTSVTYDEFRFGTYTKIGNICYVIARLRTDAVTIGSASGNVIINGLPFTVDGGNSFTVGASANFAGDVPTAALGWDSNTGILLYYRTSANGNTSGLQAADFTTAANSNIVYVSGFYKVA